MDCNQTERPKTRHEDGFCKLIKFGILVRHEDDRILSLWKKIIYGLSECESQNPSGEMKRGLANHL